MDEHEDVDEEQEDDCVPAPIVSFPFGRTHLPAEEMMLYSLPFTVLTQAEANGADIVMSQQAPRMEVAYFLVQNHLGHFVPFINLLPLERDDRGRQLSTWGMMSNDPSFLDDEPAHVATVPFGRTHLPPDEMLRYSRPTTVTSPSFEDQASTPRPAIMEISHLFVGNHLGRIVPNINHLTFDHVESGANQEFIYEELPKLIKNAVPYQTKD